MKNAEAFFLEKLQERKLQNRLRSLSNFNLPYDFCSNDYLGFARSSEVNHRISEILKKVKLENGSTGSRLISGNSTFTEQTEAFVAEFHQCEAALLFNSGYDANIGLLSSIAQRGHTIITDELIHASLIDGARLSYAERFRFRHNDLEDLESKLRKAKSVTYVVVESVYSMDGDEAPLVELVKLCKKYEANLIVDEAHAIGIFGRRGGGLVDYYQLEKDIFARIVTYGKAMGTHGAAILGSQNLKDYLINFARSFIYTTASPPHQIASILAAYQQLGSENYPSKIEQRINLYSKLMQNAHQHRIKSRSCIQTILFTNDLEAKNAAQKLQSKGFDVRAILSPTVAAGKERIRICLHLFNTDEEINNLCQHLKSC